MTNLALETRKPLLGICFGIQAINVAMGGTLIQHLTVKLKHDDAAIRHDVTVERDSMLAKLGGKNRFSVNTSHHQALGRVPAGLRVTAHSPEDGVIEAVESTEPGRFLVGVH